MMETPYRIGFLEEYGQEDDSDRDGLYVVEINGETIRENMTFWAAKNFVYGLLYRMEYAK